MAPAQVLRGMEAILRRLAGPRVRVVVERDGAPGQVQIDPSQLEQVVLNLLVNARDAMPDGGSAVLRLQNADVRAEGPAARNGVPPGACGARLDLHGLPAAGRGQLSPYGRPGSTRAGMAMRRGPARAPGYTGPVYPTGPGGLFCPASRSSPFE